MDKGNLSFVLFIILICSPLVIVTGYCINSTMKEQQVIDEKDTIVIDEGICTDKKIESIEDTILVHYIIEIDTEPYEIEEDQYNKCHINNTVKLYTSGRIEVCS
jgi:Na+-transporting NADH:ubiquinone oxidoreductase subunit NqrC